MRGFKLAAAMVFSTSLIAFAKIVPLQNTSAEDGAIVEQPTQLVVEEPTVHAMRESFSVGYLSYLIYSAKWVERSSENPLSNSSPDANFLLIDVYVSNSSNQIRQIPPFKLVDSSGAFYQSSSDGMFSVRAIGPLGSLNPGVVKLGTVLFDVPQKGDYQLRLDGGFRSTEQAGVTLNID